MNLIKIMEWCKERSYQLTLVYDPRESGVRKVWWAAIDERPGLIEDEDDCLAIAWGDTIEEALAAVYSRAVEALDA